MIRKNTDLSHTDLDLNPVSIIYSCVTSGPQVVWFLVFYPQK